MYSVGKYNGGNSSRWAVYCSVTRTWYFPERYGHKAAIALCKRLNNEI